MGRFDTTKATINANIKKNGNQEITGSILNSVMTEMVDATDAQLAELSERIDNLPKGNEFDKAGNYPLLHVGTADTAIDLAGRGESVPASFGFRASGGKSIKDGRAYIKRIKGNSVVWNQKAQPLVLSNYMLYAHSVTEDNGIHINTLVANASKGILQANSPLPFLSHKWLAYADVRSDAELIIKGIATTGFIANSTCRIYAFYTATNNGAWYWGINYKDNLPTSVDIYSFRIIDLTQMFQAGNEPTTIEEFYARVATLGVDLNAYNEGQVIHCNTESIKSVGDNAWDEEWELGTLNSTGVPSPNDTRIRSKNFTRVIPNETYYFYGTFGYGIYFYDEDKNYVTTLYVNNNKLQIPSNAMYLKFNFPTDYGTTYKGDYMLTLVHSGWKQDTDAGYQPYWQDILPLPIIRKYFPDGMKSAGSAHDEIRYNKSSGKWEKVVRIGEVDMGTLQWGYNNYGEGDASNRFSLNASKFPSMKIPSSNEELNIVTSKYSTSPLTGVRDKDKVIMPSVYSNEIISIKDTAYTDLASFKTAMAGVILYYELAEPIVTELDAEDQNFRDYYQVADFGTEQSQSSVPSAPFSADIIYQFNAVDMIREHELEITELQSIIATMQAQLTSLINGEQ